MSVLFVPVALEAYVSDQSNRPEKEIALVQPDYVRLEGRTRLGVRLEPQPFELQQPLGAGVHLHFILPDAFTHATQSEQGVVEYPRVPDRWLVTRLWQEGRICSKSWLVESDYCGLDNTESITVPFLSDPAIPYRYLGRAYPWGAPPQGEGGYLSDFDRLTAIGAGDATFAAYYPNCRSVFGFHDTLWGVPAGCITYFVQGFFSRPEQDPLHALSQAEYDKYLVASEWSAPQSETPPDHLVCCGLLYGLDWQGPEADYPSGIPQGEVDCAVGNSSVEAMSALIAAHWKERVGSGEDSMERFLTAMQYELLDVLDGTDGIAEAEDLCHGNEFEPVRHGSRWGIRTVGVEPSGVGASAGLPPVPSGAGQILSELNDVQAVFDVLVRKRAGLREDLFAAWNVYMDLADNPPPPWIRPNPSRAEAAAEARRLCNALDTLAADLATSGEAVAVVRDSLRDLLKQEPRLELEQGEAGAFYRPRDPVVLLAGEGIRRPYAYGQDGRFTPDGTLACRLETIHGLSGEASSLTRDQVNTYCTFDSTLPAPFSDLLCESLCLSPVFVAKIAAAAGCTEPSPVGPLPSPLAAAAWSQPWITLFLEWSVGVLPTRGSIKPDTSMEGWEFDGLDYRYPRIPAVTPLRYSGRTVLTPHSTQLLASVLERALERYRNDPERFARLKQMLDAIASLAVVSQQCSGFNSLLLSQKQALRLPIIPVKGEEALADDVQRCLGDADELCAPFPEAVFLPVRAGFLRVEQINVISSFGHRQLLASRLHKTVYSEQLAPPGLSENAGMLPPRLSQGARLEFNWLSHDSNQTRASLDPDTTPVCGFLYPDLLNHNLAAYDGNGEYRGTLRLVYRSGAACSRWVSAPGLPVELEKIEFSSTHMKTFLISLQNLGSGENPDPALDALLRMIGARLDSTAAAETGQELSAIWGRPLVLVRASAALQLEGSPASLRTKEDFGQYSTNQFEQLRCPLYIGDIARSLDGVIGFFPDGNHPYQSMHCIPNAPRIAVNTAFLQYEQPILLSPSDAEPACFTLLMEAGAKVSLRTGILPPTRVSLEAEHLRRAMECLHPTFELFPILGGAGEVALPLPALTNTEWAWSTPEGTGAGEPMPVAVPIPAFPEGGSVLLDGWLLQLPLKPSENRIEKGE